MEDDEDTDVVDDKHGIASRNSSKVRAECNTISTGHVVVDAVVDDSKDDDGDSANDKHSEVVGGRDPIDSS